MGHPHWSVSLLSANGWGTRSVFFFFLVMCSKDLSHAVGMGRRGSWRGGWVRNRSKSGCRGAGQTEVHEKCSTCEYQCERGECVSSLCSDGAKPLPWPSGEVMQEAVKPWSSVLMWTLPVTQGQRSLPGGIPACRRRPQLSH